MSQTNPHAESEASKVRSVSRFESNLLRILRYFLKQMPYDQVMPLLSAKPTPPNCLSAECLHLIKDMLSKGSVLYLVRSGAWRREKFLRKSQPTEGRLWQRGSIPELALSFSPATVSFLIWITANKIMEAKPLWQAPIEELTPGDSLLLFLAYEGLRIDQDSLGFLRGISAFSQNPLCRLAYPEDFTDLKTDPLPDFAPWCQGLGSLILESMQMIFRDRWWMLERMKGSIGDWGTLLQRGRSELQVLEAFMQATQKAHRLDLSRFLLEVLSHILGSDLTLAFWIGGLQGNGPARLAERLETQRAALSLLRQVGRWREWEQTARRAGYFDEDYAESKFWLSEWERFDGNRLVSRAERIIQQLEPLRTTNHSEGMRDEG